MPRNSNGNYSLPSGNPVSASTLIESLWANTTMADVGQALTESLDRYGRGTMLAAFRVADGTVTAPGVAFGSEASTGIYRSGAGVMGLAVLGVAKATLTASAFTFNTAPTWAADPASANQLTRKSYVDAAIATAGGAFLPLAGGTLTGALNVGIAGTAAAPALRLNDDNTGLYQVAANEIGFATGGIHRVTINVSGISGAGGGLTALNASNLSTGTVPDARISGAYTGLTNITASGTVTAGALTASGTVTAGTVTASGTVTAGAFSGGGGALTGLNASNLSSGTVPDARISGNYSGIGTLSLTGGMVLTSFNGAPIGTLVGGSTGGALIQGLSSAHLVVQIRANDTGDSFAVVSNSTATASDPPDTLAFRVRRDGETYIHGVATAAGGFSGNGSSLTALNASQLTSGTVPDARISGSYTGLVNLTLSGDVIMSGVTPDIFTGNATARLAIAGGTNSGAGGRIIFYGESNVTFPDGIALYGSGTQYATFSATGLSLASGSFTGNGSALTSLNASNLSSGTVPDARISGAYSGISTLTLTNQLQLPAGTAAAPALRFTNDADTGLYSPGAAVVAVSINAVDRLTVAGGLTSIIGALDVSAGISGATFTGSGSGLTALNASNLSSGTVPNARISGAYSGITTLAATSITATSQFLAPDGTTSAPGFTFTADPNTGIYRFAENDLRITCGGQALMSFAIGAITAVSSTDIVMSTSTEPTSAGSVGFRGMPVVTRNSTTAFGLSDAGETIRKSTTTAYTWTINPDATTNFPIGTVIFLLHDSTAGNITVARGAGVALVEGTTDANATLAAGERASIHKVAANRWRIYR